VQEQVTDVTLEGTYSFTLSTFVTGDNYSTCSAAMTHIYKVTIIACNLATTTLPPILSQKTVNIGVSTSFDL